MLSSTQQAVVDRALAILAGLYIREDLRASSPSAVKSFCQLAIAHLPHEVFGVLFLDNQHQLIEFRVMFRGTIDGASVHPREVAKEALMLNAAALIFTHNHPAGISTPSRADLAITERLRDALQLFDMRVLDHIIVTCTAAYSLAENGQI